MDERDKEFLELRFQMLAGKIDSIGTVLNNHKQQFKVHSQILKILESRQHVFDTRWRALFVVGGLLGTVAIILWIISVFT